VALAAAWATHSTYSITSSAIASTPAGIIKRIAFAMRHSKIAPPMTL
jgi:hypothetical protein